MAEKEVTAVEKIKKVVPFQSNQAELLQCWLEQQNAEGWELERISGGSVATFRPARNHRIHYGFGIHDIRLPRIPTQEQRETYFQRGWTYVTTDGGLYIFKKAADGGNTLPEEKEIWEGFLDSGKGSPAWFQMLLFAVPLFLAVRMGQIDRAQIMLYIGSGFAAWNGLWDGYLVQKGRQLRGRERDAWRTEHLAWRGYLQRAIMTLSTACGVTALVFYLLASL